MPGAVPATERPFGPTLGIVMAADSVLPRANTDPGFPASVVAGTCPAVTLLRPGHPPGGPGTLLAPGGDGLGAGARWPAASAQPSVNTQTPPGALLALKSGLALAPGPRRCCGPLPPARPPCPGQRGLCQARAQPRAQRGLFATLLSGASPASRAAVWNVTGPRSLSPRSLPATSWPSAFLPAGGGRAAGSEPRSAAGVRRSVRLRTQGGGSGCWNDPSPDPSALSRAQARGGPGRVTVPPEPASAALGSR